MGSEKINADKILKKKVDALFAKAKKAAFGQTMLDENSFERLLGNGDVFRKDLIALFAIHSAEDKNFGFISSFKFTVPDDYIHDRQLEFFAASRQKEMEKVRESERREGKKAVVCQADRIVFCNSRLSDLNYRQATEKVREGEGREEKNSAVCQVDRIVYCNSHLTDQNFQATVRLIPGKIYGGRIFGIKPGMRPTSPECLDLLRRQKAILVGAQGISLLQQLNKQIFPPGKWTISFDEERGLWRSTSGDLRVPGMCPDKDGWRFGLSSFDGDWGEANCLLCIYDLNA
jgi:hypothetical protein